MSSTEKDTQRAILDYLALRGICHYRQNSGAYRTEHGGFVRFGSKGAPDIVCVIQGRYIGIEVKDIKGRLNENQQAFKESLEGAGGIYLVARDIDLVIDFIENALTTKRD